MQGQFEQQLNAYMLQEQGYGAQASAPSERDLAAFLYRLPDYESRLKNYPQNGNEEIQNKLDELLADNLSKLYEFKPE